MEKMTTQPATSSDGYRTSSSFSTHSSTAQAGVERATMDMAGNQQIDNRIKEKEMLIKSLQGVTAAEAAVPVLKKELEQLHEERSKAMPLEQRIQQAQNALKQNQKETTEAKEALTKAADVYKEVEMKRLEQEQVVKTLLQEKETQDKEKLAKELPPGATIISPEMVQAHTDLHMHLSKMAQESPQLAWAVQQFQTKIQSMGPQVTNQVPLTQHDISTPPVPLSSGSSSPYLLDTDAATTALAVATAVDAAKKRKVNEAEDDQCMQTDAEVQNALKLAVFQEHPQIIDD